MGAEALWCKEGYIGAVAFSHAGDPATGDVSDAPKPYEQFIRNEKEVRRGRE